MNGNYTLKEASKLLQVSTCTIRNNIRKGNINASKIDGKWEITECELYKLKSIYGIENLYNKNR